MVPEAGPADGRPVRTAHPQPSRRFADQAAALTLGSSLVARLRDQLPDLAEVILAQITQEIPVYDEPFQGRMGRTIEAAVQVALGTFLDLASARGGEDAPTGDGAGADRGPSDRGLRPAVRASYELGRGEARSGRSMDALLSAYRLGARTSWRTMAEVAVAEGMDAATLGRFAELVFAYIDELSAASAAGYSVETATVERHHRRRRERLALALAEGAAPAEVEERAAAAQWPLPRTVTPVLLPDARVATTVPMLDSRTLVVADEVPGLPTDWEVSLLLVPDSGGPARAHLLGLLARRGAVVGPARPWPRVRGAVLRCIAWPVRTNGGDPHAVRWDPEAASVDVEDHLTSLVLGADSEALEDVRRRALAPLDDLPEAARTKLEDTLRSWLLHLGRRDDVAADLGIHPQTVRYRMNQVRERYGDRLNDAQTVLQLTIALARDAHEPR